MQKHVDSLFNQLDDGLKLAIKSRLENIHAGPGIANGINITNYDTDSEEELHSIGWSEDPKKILAPKSEEPKKQEKHIKTSSYRPSYLTGESNTTTGSSYAAANQDPTKVKIEPQKPSSIVSTANTATKTEPIPQRKVEVFTGTENGIPLKAIYANTLIEGEAISKTDSYPPLTAIFTPEGDRGPSDEAVWQAVDTAIDNTTKEKLMNAVNPEFIKSRAKTATIHRTGKGTTHGLFGRGTIDEEYAKLSPEVTSYASMAVDMIPETALDHIKNASLKSLIITAAGALVGFIDKLFTSSFLINSLKSVVQWLGNTNAAHTIAALCTNIKNILIPAFQAKLAKLTEMQIMQMVARIQPITKIAFAVWDALDGIDRAEAIVGVVNPSPLDHIIAAICQFLLGQFAGGMLYYVLGTEFTVQMIYKAASMVFNMDEYKKKYIETERLYQAFKSQPGNENITKTKWLTMEYSYWGSLLKFFSDPDLQAFEQLLTPNVDPTKKQGLNGDKRIQAHMSPQSYRRSAMKSINKPIEKPSGITTITNGLRTGFADELGKMLNTTTPITGTGRKPFARGKYRKPLFGRGMDDEEFAKLSPGITSYASMAYNLLSEDALENIKSASLKTLIVTAAGALVAFIDKLFASSFIMNGIKAIVSWLGNKETATLVADFCTRIKNTLIPAFQAKLVKFQEKEVYKMVSRIVPYMSIALSVYDAIDGIDRAEAIVGVVNPSPLDHIIAAISQFILGQFAKGMVYYVLGTEYVVQMIYRVASEFFDMNEYKRRYIETERLYQEYISQPGNEGISKTAWLTKEYSYYGKFISALKGVDLEAFTRILNAKVTANTTYKRGMNKPKPVASSKSQMLRQVRNRNAAKGTAKKKHKPAKINLVPSKFGKGFAKQIDPAVADLPYNIDGDSTAQTYYDSACGPVTAVNMLESITGTSLGSEAVIEAGTAALTGGYKELDGGTDPRFHQDYLKQHGIDTELVSTKQKIADNIEKGPTTLMIEEPTTKNRHYIETEGVTPDGLVSVNDPENPQDGILYDKQDIVNQSLIGITAKGTDKKKKPQFGRGHTPNQTDISRAVMIRNVLKQKGYSDNAIYGILANMEVESGWHFNPKQVEYLLLNEIKASGKTFGMSNINSDEYTKAVDTGAISRQEFIFPSVGSSAGKARRGYGLVQFTSADKKGLLYDTTVGQGKSIGDLGLQVEAFDSYIQKYVKGLYSSLHDPNITPTAAAEAMLAKYEIPAKKVWDKTSKERRESSIKWQQILSGNSDATMPGAAASASAPTDPNQPHQSTYNNESSTSTENKGPVSTTTGSSGVLAVLDAIKSAFTSEINKMLGIPEIAPASETSGGDTSSTTSSTEGGNTSGTTSGNVPTGPMTGGDPDKMVAIARQELGTLENPPGSNKVKYNDWIYGKKGAVAQWCANFISWVANQAGIDKSILPHVGYTPDYFDKVLKGGGREVSTKEAMKGDLMFFAGRAGRPYGVYHIGLVTGADGKGKVSTIEGNTSTKGSKDGIAVAEKVRQSTANLPLRILRPNYKDPGTPSGQQTQNTQLGEAEVASYAGTRGGGVMSSFTPKGILGRGMPYTDKVQKIKNIDGTTENIEVSGSDDELTKRLKLGEEKAKRDEIIKKAHGKTDEPETPEYGMGSGGFLDSFKDVLGGFTNNLSSIFVTPTPQAGQTPGIVQTPVKAQETAAVTPASTKPSILEKASKLASTKATPTQTQPQISPKTGEAPIKTSTVVAEQPKMIPLAQAMPAQPTNQSGSFLGNILSSFTNGEISNPFSEFLDSLSEFNPKDLLGSFIPSMESGGNFLNGLLGSFGIPVPQAPVMAGQTPGIVQGQPIVQPNSNQKPIPTEAAPKSVADVAKSITATQVVPPATEVAQKPSEVVAATPTPVKPTIPTQQPQTPPNSVADIAKAITSDQTVQTKTTSVTTPTQTQPQTPSKTGEAQPTTLPQAQPTLAQPVTSEKPIEAQKPQITQAMNILQPSTQSNMSSSPLSGLLSSLISGNTPSLPSFGDMAGNMLQGILSSQSQSQQPIMGGLTQEGFMAQVVELLTQVSHNTDNLQLMLQIMQQQTGIKVTPTQVANAQKGNSLSDRLAERLKPTTGSKEGQTKSSVRPLPKVQSTDGLSKLQAYADGTENNNIAMIKNLMESLASS